MIGDENANDFSWMKTNIKIEDDFVFFFSFMKYSLSLKSSILGVYVGCLSNMNTAVDSK